IANADVFRTGALLERLGTDGGVVVPIGVELKRLEAAGGVELARGVARERGRAGGGVRGPNGARDACLGAEGRVVDASRNSLVHIRQRTRATGGVEVPVARCRVTTGRATDLGPTRRDIQQRDKTTRKAQMNHSRHDYLHSTDGPAESEEQA